MNKHYYLIDGYIVECGAGFVKVLKNGGAVLSIVTQRKRLYSQEEVIERIKPLIDKGLI